MSNPDLAVCPDNCFRPVGLAMDAQGRMFMSSDSTNEIWVLAEASTSTSDDGVATGTGTGSSASPTESDSAAVRWGSQAGLLPALFWAVWALS